MSQTPFTQFIVLVEKDQAINLLAQSVQKIEQEKKDLHKADITLHDSLETLKLKLHDVRKHVDEQELEMKQLDDQEKRKKTQLDAITSHKEYQSIKTEIDRLRQEQHALEEHLVQAWQDFESAKKEYDAAQQQYEQKHQQTLQLLAEHDKKIVEINADLAQKEQERNEIEKSLPAEWIEKYTIMRKRVANPVVPIANGSCSACFYQISTPDMNALERNKLVQCKDCFRLLYLEKPS